MKIFEEEKNKTVVDAGTSSSCIKNKTRDVFQRVWVRRRIVTQNLSIVNTPYFSNLKCTKRNQKNWGMKIIWPTQSTAEDLFLSLSLPICIIQATG